MKGNKHEVIARFPGTLSALGRCMDILMEKPDDENALHVCNVVSNGLYLLTLKLMHCRDEELQPAAIEEMKRGADLLAKACEAFAGDSTSLSNVTEALRTLHTFQLCRENIARLAKVSGGIYPVSEALTDRQE